MGKKVKVTAKRWCALLLVAVMLCTSVTFTVSALIKIDPAFGRK